MIGPGQAPFANWTRTGATILSVGCLLAGIGGGWAVRGLRRQPAVVPAANSNVQEPGGTSAAAQPDPAQLKAAADAQAAPLIDRLKSDPKNPLVLSELGNVYYDSQQYPKAIDFYQRALEAKPGDAAVRTDMATAYWYMRDADLAITEFDKALTFAPDNPNTLFNRGLVKWQGKKDAAGALADWQRLLATDPAYDQKDKLQQMIAEVKKSQVPESAARGR